MLPDALGAFQPLGWILQAGAWLNFALIAAAVIAFAIPIFKKRREKPERFQNDTLILHDLPADIAAPLFAQIADQNGTKIFAAPSNAAPCKGFYDCWLKQPGVCALRDGIEHLGREIAAAKKLIIVSRSSYGGLSADIKRALDRSISSNLPFFDVRGKELHHQIRYPSNGGELLAYIYNGDELSEDERETITEIIRANGLNMDRDICITLFFANEQALAETRAIL